MADFKVQHKVQLNDHHSRVIARLTPPKWAGSLHAKVVKLYQRENISIFKSGSRMSIIRQIIPKCARIKSKTVTEVFVFICVQMGSIEDSPITLSWLSVKPECKNFIVLAYDIYLCISVKTKMSRSSLKILF